MRDLIGSTLGHYCIVEKIGEGGMGEVYRARDERLDRDVAVKILPEKVALNPARLTRFDQEAKAVAKLSHPNIIEIFDVGREDEISFAVTELLEGHTLREHLIKSGGPLPWRQVREVGSAVANGLSAAHDHGVVHRDLKPGNIFVCSDGRVKILDFGLASIEQAVDTMVETGSIQAPLTHQGTVMGTVGYMAPEQVRGERADSRADIFALGCVLYEMLTGQRAFKRDTTAEIMTAILREEPRPFDESGVEVAPAVAKTVQRCLEKNPERRFQSASDLAFAMGEITQSAPVPDVSTLPKPTRWRRVAVGAAALVVVALAVGYWLIRQEASNEKSLLDPEKVVIAVFENRTGDPSLDALGTLVSEALAEGASGIGDFSVIPSPASIGGRTAGGELSSGSRAIQGIAEKTGAGLVVSGAYYLLGQNLRFQAQLIDAASDEVFFSAPAVIGPRDSLGEIIEGVRERMLGAVAWSYYSANFRVTTPPLLAAFLEYRRGREFYMKDLEAEVLHFRRAVEMDSAFYSAWSSLHYSYGNRRLCDQANQILAEMGPHVSRFTPFDRFSFRYQQAKMAGRPIDTVDAVRAMNTVAGRKGGYLLGISELYINRPRAAVAALRQISYHPTDAVRVTRSHWGLWWLARAHHMLGEYEEELQVTEESLSHFPSDGILHGRKAAALAAMGRVEGIDQVIEDTALVQDDPVVMRVMVDAAAELRAHGYSEAAVQMAKRAVDWFNTLPSGRQEELQAVLADALIHTERWGDAKDVADDYLLKLPRDGGGAERGLRSRGNFWWGDGSLVVALGRVGTLAARLGEHDEALRIANRLRDFDSSCPAGNRTYQRACIASQLGDKAEAIRLLKKAVSQGYSGFWGMKADINIEPLWDNPDFLELVRPKG